jgi:hypothetical protein
LESPQLINLANGSMRPSLTTPAHAFSLREPGLLDEPDQGTPWQRVGNHHESGISVAFSGVYYIVDGNGGH